MAADKITIAWTDPGEIDGAFGRALADLAVAHHGIIGHFLRNSGGMLVRQRNEIVARFLDQSDNGWLLMLDADMLPTPAHVARLVDVAHATERPVVSGLYFGASDIPPTERDPDDHDDITVWPNAFIRAENGSYVVAELQRNVLGEVDAVGAGCLLVHRTVLNAIRADAAPHERDWCWFSEGPTPRGTWGGEDFSLCERIRDRGYPIILDTSVIVPHHKSIWIDDRHATAHFADEETTR